MFEQISLQVNNSTRRLAVLIDADNAQAALIAEILQEITRHGEIVIKRIYGDFTSPTMSSWRKLLNEHAIKPIQQFAYTSGKNATDSSLIIDAMDLLHTAPYLDGFCILSSDSDFTSIATRLREAGKYVLGIGRPQTPIAFRNACHRFIDTQVLSPLLPELQTTATAASSSPQTTVTSEPSSSAPQSSDAVFVWIAETLEQACEKGESINLGELGNRLLRQRPDFDCRNYGHKKLSDLIASRPDLFQVKQVQSNSSAQPTLHVFPVERKDH